MNRKKFKEAIGDDWFDILNDVIDEEVEVKLDLVKQLYNTSKVYPDAGHVFRAFKECQLNDLKVLWLGQDPYPTTDATGLAFEVPKGRMTASYSHLLQAFNDCFPNHFNTDVLDGNLTYLAREGVLWLNTALTVEAGKPNSHKQYWELFTKRFIAEMDKSYSDLVFVGLGKEAEILLKDINDDINKPVSNYKIILEHPAYAARQGRKWKHDNVFLKINEYLKTTKLGEIKWE